MPAFVKTPEDEKHWAEAKAQVEKEYAGKVEIGSDRYWALVNRIFHRMKQHVGSGPMVAKSLLAIDTEGRVFKARNPHDKLSKRIRGEIGKVGSKHREEMPSHVFLEPGSRKYPVKTKGAGGEWTYSHDLLIAAARRARMKGREDLASRADAIRSKL